MKVFAVRIQAGSVNETLLIRAKSAAQARRWAAARHIIVSIPTADEILAFGANQGQIQNAGEPEA